MVEVGSADPEVIAAVALLSFFVGLSIIIVVIARVIKGRRGSKKHALVADEQWLSETGKGTLLCQQKISVRVRGTDVEDFEAAGMYEDDLSPDHRAGHEAGYFEGQGCSRC